MCEWWQCNAMVDDMMVRWMVMMKFTTHRDPNLPLPFTITYITFISTGKAKYNKKKEIDRRIDSRQSTTSESEEEKREKRVAISFWILSSYFGIGWMKINGNRYMNTYTYIHMPWMKIYTCVIFGFIFLKDISKVKFCIVFVDNVYFRNLGKYIIIIII